MHLQLKLADILTHMVAMLTAQHTVQFWGRDIPIVGSCKDSENLFATGRLNNNIYKNPGGVHKHFEVLSKQNMQPFEGKRFSRDLCSCYHQLCRLQNFVWLSMKSDYLNFLITLWLGIVYNPITVSKKIIFSANEMVLVAVEVIHYPGSVNKE